MIVSAVVEGVVVDVQPRALTMQRNAAAEQRAAQVGGLVGAGRIPGAERAT